MVIKIPLKSHLNIDTYKNIKAQVMHVLTVIFSIYLLSPWKRSI